MRCGFATATVRYDPLHDVVSPRNGLTLTDDTDLLYVTKFGVAAGARYTLTHSVFTATDFLPGESVDPAVNSPIHRLRPFIAYTFFDRPGSAFNAPTIVFVAQWHLRHRYRAGQQVSAALPWIGLAFLFSGVI